MPGYVITAESVPVKDKWGFGDYWGCADWILWHQLMKDKFGSQIANYKFITEFQDQEMFAAGYDCRTTNADFRQYAKDNGFYDALFEGIGILVKPFGWGTDVIGDVGDAISNTSGGLEKITDVIAKIVPLLIILFVIGVAFYAYKKTYQA